MKLTVLFPSCCPLVSSGLQLFKTLRELTVQCIGKYESGSASLANVKRNQLQNGVKVSGHHHCHYLWPTPIVCTLIFPQIPGGSSYTSSSWWDQQNPIFLGGPVVSLPRVFPFRDAFQHEDPCWQKVEMTRNELLNRSKPSGIQKSLQKNA